MQGAPHLPPEERHHREVLFLRLYLLTVGLGVGFFIFGVVHHRALLATIVFAVIVVPNGMIGLAVRRRREQERPFD